MPKVTRQLIAEILALSRMPLYERVLKYSETQRRAPGGAPGGGRWIKGGGVRGQALADVSAKHKEFPDPIRTGRTLPNANPAQPQLSKPYWRGKSWQPVTSMAPGMVRAKGRSQAGTSTIERAGQGESLKAKPRGAGGVPDYDPLKEKIQEHEHVIEVLKTGTVSSSAGDPEGGHSNSSSFVTFPDGTEALYKPERGENWGPGFANSHISRFITNRNFSLANREAFAFEAGENLFGAAKNIVPETVLREVVDETNIEVDVGYERGGGGGTWGPSSSSTHSGEYYDSNDLQRMYNSYREQAQEDAMDAVGGEMYELYQQAQNEHVDNFIDRQNDMKEIMDEIREENPELVARLEQAEAVRNHPVLPMLAATGDKNWQEALFDPKALPFQRREPELIDPMEVLDKAGVDDPTDFTDDEREKVKALLLERMEAGDVKLDDIDENAAKEHLEYGDWIEGHQDTEMRLYDSKIQDFDDWKRDNNYTTQTPKPSTSTPETPTPVSTPATAGISSAAAAPAPVVPEKFDGRNQKAPHPKGGSFQHIRHGTKYGTLSEEGGAKLAVIDYVLGSMDRHPSNLLHDGGEPIAIDNGYSMPAATNIDNFDFRTHGVKDWANNHGTIPDALRTEIATRMDKTDWEALCDRHPGMNAAERKAFLGRVKKMKTALKTPEGLRDLWASVSNVY